MPRYIRNPSKDRIVTSLNIDGYLWAEIKNLAERDGRSASATVELALREWVKKYGSVKED